MHPKFESGQRMRVQPVTGFLGSGKTTTIRALAEWLVARELRVAVVTNDQSVGLIDTKTIGTKVANVREVSGACFCCKPDDFFAHIVDLEEHYKPDVLLTEPVGSCTDLNATVWRPLRDIHPGRVELGPQLAVIDPIRAVRVLTNDPRLKPNVRDIWAWQVDEAELIAVNKIDTTSPETVALAVELLRARWPPTPISAYSAASGTGLSALADRLLVSPGRFDHSPAVDYDRYADGEAELGWLNAIIGLTAVMPLSLAEVAFSGLKQFAACTRGAEIMHLKVSAESGSALAVVNLDRADGNPTVSTHTDAVAEHITLTINARVQSGPEVLNSALTSVETALGALLGVVVTASDAKSFRPGPPKPKYRLPV